MRFFVKSFLFTLLILCFINVAAQQSKRVLFLGNSYTYVNNLPQMLADMAVSTGKTLIYDINAPGGYYLGQHLTNPVSLAKIADGNWNHVVLQEQSMALAYSSTYRNSMPYSVKLDSIIKANNLCCQTMFYSTWGRKNGDTYVCTPPECDSNTVISRSYYRMDSTITSHYKIFADSVKAGITPVGAVWRYIRQNYPGIELFQPDESHPSQAGTYAAACSFYATIFRSDPSFIVFNGGLSTTDANAIKAAVKHIIFNHLSQWNVGPYDFLLDNSCLVSGIGSHMTEREWSVFPNPVTDALLIRFSAGSTKEKIEVYNSAGSLVKELEMTGQESISFKEWADGVYLIRRVSDNVHFKILKK